MPQSNVNPRKTKVSGSYFTYSSKCNYFWSWAYDIHKTTFINRVEISDDKKYAKIFVVPGSSDIAKIENEIDALNKISGFFRKK